MKSLKFTISVTLLMAILSVYADRRLSVRCLPVDMQKTVWNFIPSGTDEIDEGPLYRMYGDTPLTEIFDRKRQWYAFKDDSCLYTGEDIGMDL